MIHTNRFELLLIEAIQKYTSLSKIREHNSSFHTTEGNQTEILDFIQCR